MNKAAMRLLHALAPEKAYKLTLKLLNKAAMPLLHTLPPEMACELVLKLLNARAYLPGISTSPQTVAPRRVMGIDFANPCGIAAGLDKNGKCLAGLSALGCGFIELGTVTPKLQKGNPRPRIKRLPQQQALLNKIGCENKGLDSLLRRLNQRPNKGPNKCIIGINLGANRESLKDEELALSDYIKGLKSVYKVADYVCINISSPNVPRMRSLQQPSALQKLLRQLKKEQMNLARANGKYTPLSIKLSPDLEKAEIRDIATIIGNEGIDGVTATNTSVRHRWSNEFGGGISGMPLAPKALETLGELRHHLPKKVALIAVGGIFSAEEMHKRLDAGASLIQVYTGLIYKGFALINELLSSLSKSQIKKG